jgi:hypothetical protein
VFQEGELGKNPMSGGNLSTYKELCSLATDMGQPDLVYKFMHLANYNATWNSRKGIDISPLLRYVCRTKCIVINVVAPKEFFWNLDTDRIWDFRLNV